MENKELLSVKGISKSFGDTKAVRGISFNVKKGEIFGLLGPNGAGKTTSIRMLMGITAPDEGAIDYNFDFDGSFQKRVGYLPEERGMYQSTKLLETIIYFGQLKGMDKKNLKKTAEKWLERLELADYADKKIEELSKGMQQKLQFIISIIHKPEFVVLDELFAGLDPVNQDLFKDIVRDLVDEGMTVLLSSHRMEMVEELCDRIFLINKGEQVLYGQVNEIKNDFEEDKVVMKYEGRDRFFKGHKGVTDLKLEKGKASFYLASGVRPDEFIREIPGELQIKEISVTKPSLHEIFVRTVKEGERA